MWALRRFLSISWTELGICGSVGAWCTTNFHLFHATHFRGLLVVKTVHSNPWYHLMTYVSWKFIGRTLIRISHSLILMRALIWITHCVMTTVMLLMNNANIPIALRKGTDSSHIVTFFICIGHELPSSMTTHAWQHSGCILVSNSIFSSLQLLILKEFIMPASSLYIWAIVPSMTRYLIGVMLAHLSLLLLFITLLIWASSSTS